MRLECAICGALRLRSTQADYRQLLSAVGGLAVGSQRAAKSQYGIVTLTRLPRNNTRRRRVSRSSSHGSPPAHCFSSELAKRSS
jgi:hypothetical protein